MKKIKNIGLFLIASLMVISCQQAPKENAETEMDKATSMEAEAVSDGIFIHITESYDDPHRLLMPLKMATMMAQDKDVLVYMDIDAVKILVKEAEDLSYADFESAQSYIKQLTDNGVGVYACPTCLQLAGFEASDLLEGVQIAQKDKFFNFSKGRIITLDY
mgnify:FL=1